MSTAAPPVGVTLSADVEHRPDRRAPFRARVRWVDPATKRRQSKSEAFETEQAAVAGSLASSALPSAASIRLRPR
jgi:hypothetical protein